MAKENAIGRGWGIILAGAYPGGQCALDQLTPRPLLPVAQQPLITYALHWMEAGGLPGVTICTNSAARAVQSRVRQSAFALRIDYLEDWSPRGPAGCVRDAGLRTEADTLVVADATAVPVVDLQRLVGSHRNTKAAMTVVVDADPAGRLRPSGLYVFTRRALDFIPAGGFQDIKEKLIPRLYAAGEHIATEMARGVSPRVVNADTYLALNEWALERALAQAAPQDGFQVSGTAVVHGTATVDPSARMLGPVLVGPRVSVNEGATLVGPVSIGPGTWVGPRAVVSRSVVWSGCFVGEGAFVDRCMLADGATVEPRRSIFAAVKESDRGGQTQGLRTRRPRRSLWDPIMTALRPVTPHDS